VMKVSIKLFAILISCSLFFNLMQITKVSAAAPAGSDYAYDKEFSTSSNKIWASSQVIPAGSADPLTVETWINLESYTTDWMAIFTQNQSDALLTNRLWFGFNGGAKTFHIGTSAATTDSTNTEAVIPVGTWTHIALTLDANSSNNAKIYVNGELFHQATLSRSATTNERGFAIGTNTAGGHRFDGRIDNVKVWNTVLTQDQLRASRYAYGSEGITGSPSLRAFYDFDEGSGSTVNDRSGNGYNLAISSASGTVEDAYVSSTRQKAIAYNTQGATTNYSGGSITFNNGSTISQIPTTAPTKTNFTFSGWFTAASSGSQISNGSAMPNNREATVTLYAQWLDSAAPTFTSSSSFSAAENIATSANAATIKVSESATVTISSGVDASLFNIIASDSVTVFIRFKSSPNFEAPSDSGGNNVYDLVLTATDLSSNSGNQTITITVTDVVETSSFNSLVLSGSATYRQVVTITANVSVAAKVTFRAKNVIIAGCKNKTATGSGSSFTATCSWKPSVRGAVRITATAVPTSGSISSSTANPLNVVVGNRSGGR